MSLRRILGGLPRELYVVAISSFLFSMGKSMTAPILTLHMREVGATVFQIGSILSLQSGLLIAFRIPFTLIARRKEKKGYWHFPSFLNQQLC